MFNPNLSLLSLLKKEKKPITKFPIVISESRLSQLKNNSRYLEIPLNPKIIHDYHHVLIYYPYSMEHLDYQSRYSTTRNMSLINLMIPIKWYKFINQVYIFYKSNWSYRLMPKRKVSLDLENFTDLPIYFFYYARFRKRFLKIIPRTYLDYPDYKSLMYYYETENFYFNTNYLWHLIFQDPLTQKLINLITKKGKKEKAELMIYKIFFLINQKFGHLEHPILILREALENIKPIIKLDNLPFSRRAQSVPNIISLRNQLKLAFKWILHEVHSNKEIKPFYYKLYLALINAYFEQGYAFEQSILVQKLAYDQRAFMYKNYYLRKKQKNKIKFYVPTDYPEEEEEETNINEEISNGSMFNEMNQTPHLKYLDVILNTNINSVDSKDIKNSTNEKDNSRIDYSLFRKYKQKYGSKKTTNL